SLRSPAIYTSAWAWIRAHAPEILLYLVVRLLGVCVLAVMAHRVNVTGLLGKWDGAWYIGIAQHGYNTSLSYRADGSLVNTNVVFFPLYPLLIRVLGWPLGLLHAALAVSWLAGIGAAVAIRAVGEYLYDRRTGIVLAVLWGILPTALVESMAYTESLLTLLMALALLFLLRHQWIAAGVASFFAGLTHPTGLTIAAAIDVCAAVAIVRRTGSWRVWIGGLLAPLGAVGYLAWVGAELGRWDGWSFMQRQGWHNSPSASGTWHEVHLILTKPVQLGYYVALAVVLLAILSAAFLTWGRTRGPLAVLVFTWLSIAAALSSGSTYFHSKARFLLPVFTLLLPLAAPLARQRLRTIATLLGSGALASAWYGGYLLTVWTRSP
ncbi:MAG TPA: hypothetical protein VGS97_13025, partial [Actinocrinis sp.]|uniref:hypothetical protein n=1 Tax=Actinocrinis sp. TaxID=1920516 RepID=UPI002DDD6960